MSVYKLVATLDNKQTRIAELENKMSTQKDDITIEFEKALRIVDSIHKEEVEKVLQT